MTGKVFQYIEKNGISTVKETRLALQVSTKEVKSACELFVANGLLGKRKIRRGIRKETAYYAI